MFEPDRKAGRRNGDARCRCSGAAHKRFAGGAHRMWLLGCGGEDEDGRNRVEWPGWQGHRNTASRRSYLQRLVPVIGQEVGARDGSRNLREVETCPGPLKKMDVYLVRGGRRSPLPAGNELRLTLLIHLRS